MDRNSFLSFPKDFLWGAATSAYQIEGGANQDGRGPSIWDTFTEQPGKIHNNDTAEVTADHYNRWKQDVSIMEELGLKAYRFSISWPRVQPSGSGRPNQAGMGFYEQLVDALLEKGIQPVVTLYHWDLPQALQDQGGWANREIVHHFAEYAELIGGCLGDRVQFWITHNEPYIAAMAGHFTGEHAPGLQDPVAALQTAHYLLLSHGYAVQALRSRVKVPAQIGIAMNLSPVHPASESPEDLQAMRVYDSLANQIGLDALFKGNYPIETLPEELNGLLGILNASVQPGDMEIIATPMDFLGVNYYTRTMVRHDPLVPFVGIAEALPKENEYSQMWEIYPVGLYELLERIWRDHQPAQILITENGIPVVEGPDLDGQVRDYRRIRFLRDHLAQLHRAIEGGIPVKGYFVWSLLDNFEWAYGFKMRFGMVYVDYPSLKRTIKLSGFWYRETIERNGLSLEEGDPWLPC